MTPFGIGMLIATIVFILLEGAAFLGYMVARDEKKKPSLVVFFAVILAYLLCNILYLTQSCNVPTTTHSLEEEPAVSQEPISVPYESVAIPVTPCKAVAVPLEMSKPSLPEEGFFYYAGYYKERETPYTMPMSRSWQRYVYDICQEYDVEFELALALMGVESSFDPNKGLKIGKNGVAYYGVGMVNIKYETPRMEKIGVTLQTPKGGIISCVSCLARKLKEFNDNYKHALMAYNNGSGLAKQKISKGIHETGYTEKVLIIYNGLKKWRSIHGSIDNYF